MTIPTRDELVERAREFASSFDFDMNAPASKALADFALSEGRRWVAEELEAVQGLAWAHGNEVGDSRVCVEIDARLAALREQTEQPNTAPPTTEDSQRRVAPSGSGLGGALSREANLLSPNPSGGRQHASSGLAATSTSNGPDLSGHDDFGVRPAQATPGDPARLSDADALEAAAMVMRERGIERTTPTGLECMAHDLRAASAPVPVPKPVDVFRAFSMWTDDRDHKWIEGHARDWFGPLVAALEELERVTPHNSASYVAHDALEALRQRAQEASR